MPRELPIGAALFHRSPVVWTRHAYRAWARVRLGVSA